MMGNWKSRKLVKGLRASHESGKKKGIHPSQLTRYLCKANRSYKHPEYTRVMSQLDGMSSKTKLR